MQENFNSKNYRDDLARKAKDARKGSFFNRVTNPFVSEEEKQKRVGKATSQVRNILETAQTTEKYKNAELEHITQKTLVKEQDFNKDEWINNTIRKSFSNEPENFKKSIHELRTFFVKKISTYNNQTKEYQEKINSKLAEYKDRLTKMVDSSSAEGLTDILNRNENKIKFGFDNIMQTYTHTYLQIMDTIEYLENEETITADEVEEIIEKISDFFDTKWSKTLESLANLFVNLEQSVNTIYEKIDKIENLPPSPEIIAMRNYALTMKKQFEEKSPVPVTSPEEYLSKISINNPEKEHSPEYLEKWVKENRKIQDSFEKLSYENNRQMIDELEENGIYRKAQYFSVTPNENPDQYHIPKDEEEYWYDLRLQNKENILPQNMNIFLDTVYPLSIKNEAGDIVGRQYYVLNGKEIIANKKLRDTAGDIIIESNKKIGREQFALEEKREKELQERVQKGELAYLGELTTDDLIVMQKNGIPRNLITDINHNKGLLVEVWRFDEDSKIKNYQSGRGCYALL